MKFRISRRTLIFGFFILVLSLGLLSSCGSKYGQTTLYLQENAAGGGCAGCGGNPNAKTKFEWMIIKIEDKVDPSLTAEEKLHGKTVVDGEGNTTKTPNYIDNFLDLVSSYAREEAIANTDEQDKIDKHFKVANIRNDKNRFATYISNITTADAKNCEDLKQSLNGTIGCFDTKTEKHTLDALKDIENVTDIYRLTALFMIQVDQRLVELEPIVFHAETVGQFFAHLWNNLFIFPLAWLLYALSHLFGGYYVVGLLLTTILVRTLGWPIYSKTNDMSLKMGMMQPELQKIQDKYAGRQDPDSQRMMQMESAQLYKKYKIGLGGCFAPFLQFPIFMAIFNAISRLPYTVAIEGSSIYKLDWANQLKSSIFGVNLFEGRATGGLSQLIGIIVLIVLVVGTQILSQFITTRRQKSAAQKQQEDIPAYRRQAYNQTQNSAQSSMKVMLWVMIFMMGMFVWTSKAGLGVYWLIGNLYSMVQMLINSVTSEKRAAKLKLQRNEFSDYIYSNDSSLKNKKKKNKKK